MKWMFVLICLVMFSSLVLGLFHVVKVKRDVPLVYASSFVECVSENGKLDLIDRASVKYNPSALVDGSLSECDK